MQKEALSVQLLSSGNTVQYGNRYLLAETIALYPNVFKGVKDLCKKRRV